MVVGRHKAVRLLLVGSLMLASTAAQEASCTARFGDGYSRETINHWCEAACTVWKNATYENVIGTFAYDESSLVCLSALHAGVLEAGQKKLVSYAAVGNAFSLQGTIRNRVLSNSKQLSSSERAFSFMGDHNSEVSDYQTGVETVMVHNNIHQVHYSRNPSPDDVPLYVACFPVKQGQMLPYRLFERWNFQPNKWEGNDDVQVTAKDSSLTLQIRSIQNSRVLRCLSNNPKLDVVGIFGRQYGEYVPQHSTVTTSRGEDFTWVPYDSVIRNRLPHVSSSLTGTLTNLSLQDDGLYSFKKTSSGDASYARLIVRSCPRDRFGADCSQWCPDCQNSGECHPGSGLCVCAPGTYGDRCENYCLGDRYGAGCQLTCTSSHLSWATTASCLGLTFCTHDPKGCTCAPGYSPPACDEGCGRGMYGPDCALACRYCRGNSCDPVEGRCHQGCVDHALCDDRQRPRNLPRFRAGPSVTCAYAKCGVSLHPWSSDSEEGILEPGSSVTGYRLQVQAMEGPTPAVDKWQDSINLPAVGASSELKFNFVPGQSYFVRALVNTSSGSADEAYNLRIPYSQIDIPCLDRSTYGNVILFPVEITQTKITIAGVNSNRCGGPAYKFTVNEFSTRREVKNKSTEAVRPNVDGLLPKTTYVLSVNSVSITLTTLPEPPMVADLKFHAEATLARVEWSSQDADNFTVAWKKVKSEGCHANNRIGETSSFVETQPSAILSSLEGYSRYEVCVQGFNKGGGGNVKCEEFVTKPNRGPSLVLSDLRCTSHRNSGSCSVDVSGNCSEYHGPNPTLSWRLTGAPSCNTSASLSIPGAQGLTRARTKTLYFKDLIPFVNYSVSVIVNNDHGGGDTLLTTFISLSDTYPAAVEDLQFEATATSVTLYWRPPCPPKAQITSYRVKDLGSRQVQVVESECPDGKTRFCYTVKGLTPDLQYYPKVASCTVNYCSEDISIPVITKPTVPGPPTLSIERKERSLNISFSLISSGIKVISCNVEAYHGENLVSNNTIDKLQESPSCEITGLDHSKLYQVSAYCLNEMGIGNRTNETHATLLLPPQVQRPLSIKQITSTNATLILPRLNAGDSNVTYTIMVHNMGLGADPVNFTEIFSGWKENKMGHRTRRSSSDCPTVDPVYIAGQLSQEDSESEFVVGSGMAAEGLSNCPLIEGNTYDVAVVLLSVLADEEISEVVKLPQPFVAGPGGLSAAASASISIFTIVVLVVLVVALVLRRRQQAKPGLLDPQEKESNNSLAPKRRLPGNLKRILVVKPTPASGEIERVPLAPVKNVDESPKPNKALPPVLKVEASPKPIKALPPAQRVEGSPKPPPGGGKIVLPPAIKGAPFGKPALKVKPGAESAATAADTPNAYVNEDGTATASSQVVVMSDMEQYLNKIICSSDIMHQFSAMPTTYEKPMTDAEKTENRQKNRYRNNYPYNETRVRLKIINGDPNSDYINANFVKGAISARRYIASQGPKDTNKCTISDFWRMIVEQDVNVIIMVANFTEKDMVKVGMYFSYDGQVALPDVDGAVTIISTETTSYCTISKIQVELTYEGRAEVRRVSHYHYTKWPDHGVPVETLTLSNMLKRIATSHENLNAVVHCSAGIGRTGTVIFDLVCYDYLIFTGKVDLMRVLEDLRMSRARLVENQMQFKLCLQLLDEILFGFQTVILASELDGAMESLLQECRNWFLRLNNLPSSLSFSTASWNENLPFNRSPNILPADSHRMFVQSTSGQQQYVNAIRVDGLQGNEAYIVTEHPLPGRLEPFWNMVLAKKCPSIVILNPQYDETFPEVFPKTETELVAGPVKVKCITQTVAGTDLTAHKISVTNGKSTMFVTVYEVTGWSRGAPSPPDVTSLVRVAVALHGSASSTSGPPLLVCGDGVTACGLAVGVLRVVDRIKERQDIDVYRIAVKLRRCRKQFFVDEVQLQDMLRAAQMYLSEFQDYSNFK